MNVSSSAIIPTSDCRQTVGGEPLWFPRAEVATSLRSVIIIALWFTSRTREMLCNVSKEKRKTPCLREHSNMHHSNRELSFLLASGAAQTVCLIKRDTLLPTLCRRNAVPHRHSDSRRTDSALLCVFVDMHRSCFRDICYRGGLALSLKC